MFNFIIIIIYKNCKIKIIQQFVVFINNTLENKTLLYFPIRLLENENLSEATQFECIFTCLLSVHKLTSRVLPQYVCVYISIYGSLKKIKNISIYGHSVILLYIIVIIQ